MTTIRTALATVSAVVIAGALSVGGTAPVHAAPTGSPVPGAMSSSSATAASVASVAELRSELPEGDVLVTQYASDVMTWLVRSADGRVHVNLRELTTGLVGTVLLDGDPEPEPDAVHEVVGFGVGTEFDASFFAGTVGADVRGITLHTDRGDSAAAVVDGHWLATWEGRDLGDEYDGPVPATVTLRDGSSYETAIG